jgi:RHS repeat-associated protein
VKATSPRAAKPLSKPYRPWFRRRSVPIAWVALSSFSWSTLFTSFAWAASPAETRVDARSVQRADLSGTDRQALQSSVPAELETASSKLAAEASAGKLQSLTAQLSAPGSVSEIKSLPSAAAPLAAQAISVPSGPATLSGMGESFTAQLTTGIASLTTPFSLPKARGNAQPSLALSYASSSGVADVGVGWALAASAFIARQTDRGLPGYDDRAAWHPNQDRFVFGGQELVPICVVAAGACDGALDDELMPTWADGWQYFRPRIEGAFMRFFWSADHRSWRIQSQDGGSIELGVPLDGSGYTGGLEANPSKPSEIYRWLLTRQYDAHGSPNAIPPAPVNVVVYRYTGDPSLRRLSDVYYTPPVSGGPAADLALYAHHVRLRWGDRPDATTSYRAGFAQAQDQRLLGVDVTSKPFDAGVSAARELVRRYHLTYDPSSHISLLLSLQMEGRCIDVVQESAAGDLPSTDCSRLPEMTFDYQRVKTDSAPALDARGKSFEPLANSVRSLPNSPPYSIDERQTALVDVNADALPDLLVTAPGLFGGSHGLYLNGASGASGFAKLARMSVTGVSDVDAEVLSFTNANVAALDPDGDGQVDLLHMPRARKYSIFTPAKLASGWSWVGRNITTAGAQDPKIDFTANATRSVRTDVNGDGLVDVVFSSATELQTFFALGRLPGGDGQFGHGDWSGPDSATLSNEPVRTCLPWSATGVAFDAGDIRMADLNGDGLPDIARVRDGQLLYWPGRGNGFWGTGDRDACAAGSFGQDQHVQMVNAPTFGSVDAAPDLQLADVNADGLADLVEFRLDAVDVYLNDRGVGFADRQIIDKTPVKANGRHYVQVTDVDGSGTPDLVWGHGYDYQYIDLTGGAQPYLLKRVHNGLGKISEFQYQSSTQLMLAAEAAGKPWRRTMPLSVPVVVRSIVYDQLEKVGRPAGAVVTEYQYRDPVFDGRQREFRGFETAETKLLGDATAPTSRSRSTFMLGQCQAAQNAADTCSTAERWRDNWREPLKGLPVVVESYDDSGVYLSTTHHTYELRQLYTGLDGRRVSVAFLVRKDTLGYDTAQFTPSSAEVTFDAVRVNLADVQQLETRAVTQRSDSGTVHLTSARTFDDFGNSLTDTDSGCIEGCAATDEIITQHAEYALPSGDTSGWAFRSTRSYVTGSTHPEVRHDTRQEYDATGVATATYVTLSGTLPLDRFHSAGGDVAPAPTNAALGVAAPIEVQVATYDHDVFGNLTLQRAPLGRCYRVVHDLDYEEFPLSETVYGGALDAATGCGEHAFVTQASYDRGLGVALSVRSVAGQPARIDYDGFGRVTAKTVGDPDHPGQLAPRPKATYQYLLTDEPDVSPYSIVVTRELDGKTASEDSYHEKYVYLDGLGRALAGLNEADPTAGDGGQYVVGGVRAYNSRGAEAKEYETFFWDGDPLEYPLSLVPSTNASAVEVDAFGRTTLAYSLDGTLRSMTQYHALSQDLWDAEDLKAGPHGGTYATAYSDGHGRNIHGIERVRVGAVLEERHQRRQYLPGGELELVTLSRLGSPDVVRWFAYDTLGRMVLNVEPNSTAGFSPDPSTPPGTFNAWRYAYDDVGQLVGTSDARGCGENYTYDTAGRLTSEDYSPCRAEQAAYSAPDLAQRTGVEVLYTYDQADASLGTVSDANNASLNADVTQYWGRIVSVADRGTRAVLRYDAIGRVTGGALQVAKPGPASDAMASRYAPRWYITTTAYDGADRPVSGSSGVTTAELLGTDGTSSVTTAYSRRGAPIQNGSSYGLLVQSVRYDADGRVHDLTLGDAASTQRTFSYDQRRRVRAVQTYRGEPQLWSSAGYPTSDGETQQLLLEDSDYEHDAVDNVTAIVDYRDAAGWPSGAKPVTRRFEYGDDYRLTTSSYEYAGGSDTWQSPFAAENEGGGEAALPAPHVSFGSRVLEQRYDYDYLGNITHSGDDQAGFYDRSLGSQTMGEAETGPHQLLSASNREDVGVSERAGDLEAAYDPAGNLTDLTVRREGACLPFGASCWQRFEYQWDELNRMTSAKRWDLEGSEQVDNDQNADPVPDRAADVVLSYSYDAGGRRVLKTAVDANAVSSHTVYINAGYELRHASFSGGDYTLDRSTATVYLNGGSVRARVVYSEQDLPALSSGKQHVFLELGDHLGSSAFIIDRETGELVEYSTYQAYGAADSDYRPERWGQFREHYKFSGKEEDVEVGLQYFGGRFLVTALGRWANPDPVAVQEARGDLNVYAYVGGRPVNAVDPNGREIITAIVVGIVVGAIIAGSVNAAMQYQATGHVEWSFQKGGVLRAATIGGISGGITGGVGTLVSGALTGVVSGTAGEALTAFGTGLACGAAGGASDYIATISFKRERFDTSDFFKSVGTGALVGGAFGTLNALALGLNAWSTSAEKPTTIRPTQLTSEAVFEAFAVGTTQSAVAFGFLKLIGASDELAAAGAFSAFVNGNVAGARGIYNWEHPTGWIAASLDCTVGLVGTTISNVQNIFSGGSYVASESYRQNRNVSTGGIGMQDYAFTPGSNTVSNWQSGHSGSQDLLNLHESVHMWQSRVFGPVFQATTLVYMVSAAPVGFFGAAFTGENVIQGAMATGYASSPFERPAYGNQHYWPPGDRVPKSLLVWP